MDELRPVPVLPPEDEQVPRRWLSEVERHYEDEVRFRWIYVGLGFAVGLLLTLAFALTFMGGPGKCY